jgi:hypothetical protein
MKKEKVKKIKQPRKRRATTQKKVGAKDKSVKQNVNVNVTSSGGGGSGGSAIPSAQPSYNPFISSSMQGQKQGENIEIKRLTDLLNKSLSQASKPPQNIVEKATEKIIEVPRMEEPRIEMREQPLFEGDVFKENIRLERKPDLSNLSLLQNINTNKEFDDALKVNVPQEVEDAENINQIEYEEPIAISKPDADEQFEENIVDPDNFFAFSDKVLKNKYNKPRIDQVINKTFDDYKMLGQGEPFLFDELNDYHFKIIDGSVVPWNSNESRGPLKEYVKGFVKSHYSANPEEIKDINEETMIIFGKAPNKNQSNILSDYYTNIEEQKALKEQLKASKAKKTKSKAKAKQDQDLAGQDIEV